METMMSKGINKVILIGNLGVDPDTRYLTNGSTVTNLSIATSSSWKDKQSGEQRERTEWHRVVLYNRLAEISKEYLKKGSKVYIEGILQYNKWQDENNNDRYSTQIIATNMQMLDNKSSAEKENKEFSSDIKDTKLNRFDDDLPF